MAKRSAADGAQPCSSSQGLHRWPAKQPEALRRAPEQQAAASSRCNPGEHMYKPPAGRSRRDRALIPPVVLVGSEDRAAR
eukprot:1404494-Alexandrium_andersonii.AAC.1